MKYVVHQSDMHNEIIKELLNLSLSPAKNDRSEIIISTILQIQERTLTFDTVTTQTDG